MHNFYCAYFTALNFADGVKNRSTNGYFHWIANFRVHINTAIGLMRICACNHSYCDHKTSAL